jgi:pyridinium-3,5-bisthiocarboxylic acid mononucleotide nickel chelatase
MRTAWFHCFAGTAGDMTLGALVHAGADPPTIATMLQALDVGGYALSFERVLRGGIAATQTLVAVPGPEHERDRAHDHDHDHGHVAHRPYAAIRDLIVAADLPLRVAERAARTFALLADVEGALHGVPADEVEFHEVGSLDAIIDVVGVCAGLEALGVERIVCSPITHGMGTVATAHGTLPHPAPATLELLARRGAPARGVDDPRELATPTGVALMCALADEFGPLPAMRIDSVGYGAGRAEISGRPNVVQVVVGDAVPAPSGDGGQPVQLLETNVDDMTGEVIAHTVAALLRAGAHDAWATPTVSKKGRPAYTLHALCDPSLRTAIASTLIAETGTLGVRGTTLTRWPEARTEATVVVDGHPIGLKVSAARVKVEHDDAVAAAAATGRPLRDVLAEAERLAGQPSSAERTS